MRRQPTRTIGLLCAAVSVVSLAACSSSGSGSDGSATGGAVKGFAKGQVEIGKATGDVDSVTWSGDYRPIYSLDPIKLADYPEETVIPNICEPMLKVAADYTISTGAVEYKDVDATHVSLTLQPGVTFSDGTPVTADDVAFSIERNLDPKVGSNYGYAFANVASVDTTGDGVVTLTLKQADQTLKGTLSTLAGAIVSKKFVEEKGDTFGAPNVGVLCTGPFTMESYDGTSKLVMKRNDNYWDAANKAKAKTFTFVFPADTSAMGNGLAAGDIDGSFNLASTLLASLKTSKTGKTYVGEKGSTPVNIDLLMTRSDGTMADVKVRQALSAAIDRVGIAEKIFRGSGDPLYRVSGPGLWGYATKTFADDYAKLPTKADVAAGKKLVESAGAEGKPVTMAYPSGDPQSEQLATITQQTGKAIGLDFRIKALPLQQYGSLFADPSARAKFDMIITKNYVERPEPISMDQLFGRTGGATNFSDYSNSTVDEALAKATATTDEEERAQLVLTAEHQLDKDLPSIPIVGIRAIVYLNDDLAGAPLTFSYMSSAWAARIGAK